MSRRRLWIPIVVMLTIAWGSAIYAVVAGWGPTLGLDLKGGFAVTLVAPEGTPEPVLEQAVEIMRQRVENLGSVQEPEISVQGNRSILVQLPGVEDRDRALEAVGTTGTLSFRPVLEAGVVSPAFTNGTLPLPEELQATTTTTPGETSTTQAGDQSETTAPEATTTVPEATTTTAAPVIPDNMDPETGLTIVDDIDAEAYLPGQDGLIYHVGPAFLTGADITGAQAGFIGGNLSGGVIVDPEFTDEGAVKFEDATAMLSQYPVGDPRRQMAIVLDGVVDSAPAIDESVAPGTPLDADQVYITIGTSENAQTEAEDLATILQYGALPAQLERERVESISASLGEDALRAGLIAGIGALILVAVLFVVYYRAFGLIAVIGLSIFGSLLLLVLGLLSEFQGATLTLAGVTGIIVSVGITSDSYVVFFERVKEDHRKGRALRPSVDQGFKRAFKTILTADFIAFAGSVLLWILAIGPVKGFALTLGLSTLIDVLVAWFFTRPASMLMVRSRFGEGHGPMTMEAAMGRRHPPAVDPAGGAGMREFFGKLHRGETDIDFMAHKRMYFTVAGVLVGISLLSMVFRGFNFSIEFTGGTFLEAANESGLSLGEYRDAVAAVGQGDARLQFIGDENEGITVATEPLDNQGLDALIEAVAEAAGVDSDDVAVDAVGPTFGSEITRRAIQALVVFLVVVSIFITIRYEWKMAAATLVAVFHDLIVTAGVYSIVGFEVTPATVIAVLTILGYSLYDGVVVFDKIDENVHALGSKHTFTEITNISMNEVLMRSMVTVLTTLIPIGSLLFLGSFVLGARPLEDFALALFIGVAAGTFSSVFLSTPLLAVWREREPEWQRMQRRAERRAGEPASAPAPPVATAPAAVDAIAESPDTVVPAAVGTAPAPGDGTRPAPDVVARPPRQRRKRR